MQALQTLQRGNNAWHKSRNDPFQIKSKQRRHFSIKIFVIGIINKFSGSAYDSSNLMLSHSRRVNLNQIVFRLIFIVFSQVAPSANDRSISAKTPISSDLQLQCCNS